MAEPLITRLVLEALEKRDMSTSQIAEHIERDKKCLYNRLPAMVKKDLIHICELEQLQTSIYMAIYRKGPQPADKPVLRVPERQMKGKLKKVAFKQMNQKVVTQSEWKAAPVKRDPITAALFGKGD